MTWQFDEQSARFAFQDYRGEFRLTSPERGLAISGSTSRSEIAPLLGVSFADANRPRIQDCYQRIDDFIAVYPQTSYRPFNIQLQYRVFANGEADSTLPEQVADAGGHQLLVEQWISNSTFLLDSHPQLDVELFPIFHDAADAIQVWQDIDDQLVPLATADSDGANIAVVVAQPFNNKPAIAVFVHPLDQSDADFAIRGSDDGASAGVAMLRLFDRFMEKGVIRRARLRLLISSEAIDDETLRTHYDHFANSPLPLTT